MLFGICLWLIKINSTITTQDIYLNESYVSIVHQFSRTSYICSFLTARKVSKYKVFFCSVFSCIRTEYVDLLRKSPYLVQIQENADNKKLRIWTLFTQRLISCILPFSSVMNHVRILFHKQKFFFTGSFDVCVVDLSSTNHYLNLGAMVPVFFASLCMFIAPKAIYP